MAEPPIPVEWEDSDSETTSDSDSVGCLSARMGRNEASTGGSWSPQECQLHINCLELLAAQLALKTLVKSQQGATPAGQLYSSSIHQQPGENCLTIPDSPGEVYVAVGSRERHNDCSPTHPGGIQHDSRQRVQVGKGQIRLDAIPQRILEDQPTTGSIGSDLICLQADS